MWGAADQIEQVFLNVLVNAWHAMPEGGTVSIEARETEDARVRIAFRDTGTGMSEAMVEKACEPFFSTKGEKGTGLGLPSVNKLSTIIRDACGWQAPLAPEPP